jgi:hypothetical protein
MNRGVFHVEMFATPGKDAETVKAFAEDLAAHGAAATDPGKRGVL